MLSISNHQNPDAAVNKLLKDLSIPVDPETVSSELDKHPDYPSLLAISDVLTALNIQNAAYRIEYDNLINVPCPFVAHTNINGGDFVVVNKMGLDKVSVSSEKWNNHKLDTAEFKKIFKGIVLTAEPGDGPTIAPKIKDTLSAIKTPAVAIGLGVILLAALVFHSAYFTNLSWQSLLLTVFKSVGLITSVLLLVQSIDSNNPLVQKLCQGGGGGKTNCNEILSSKAAKVFDGLSWSEVGFFYFAGTWLMVLFGGGSASIWWALAILNVVSLPYTFYSIYYQARVAKQWCVLCCTVQAMLWLEFIAIVLYVKNIPIALGDDPARALSTIAICLLLPVILWILIKPLFLKTQQLSPLKKQLHKFKYNTELFTKLLTEQPKYATPDEEWSIVLGNVEANNIITMVSNPYCQPCSKMHEILIELMEQRGDLQARIVFATTNTDDDIRTPVSRHLMALNQLKDKSIVQNALHDWYEQKQKDYPTWAKAYPVQLNEADFYKLDKQSNWVRMAEVTATPTMLLNGYRVPDLYQLPDLKYMLD
ncbi:vitamin K epoxide reductase family protein [Mucilaginibacter sp.]|uniref:vitamin K epoxide reductase family protein n=1 Tax=Mucilaginibacter sp. TaxID=1882438 RepID=UPI003D13CE57